jgi:transcriptional regulator with XRE-family HTH domain
MGFKDKLREAMDKHGLTEKDIRVRFGVSKGTVERWLNGDTEPHPVVQEAMWKDLDHKIWTLTEGEEG